jgi:hypothetical protein
MTTPDRPKSLSRRRSVNPRSAAAPDWGAVEQTDALWSGLRITEGDLPRVAAFLETQRARRLHRDVVDFQERLRRAVTSLEWAAELDPMTLMAVVLVATHVRDSLAGFPPAFDHRPFVDRWVVFLHWLLLVAEDAKLPVLSLAQRAMTAALTRDGAIHELARRVTTHLGFDAASVPLLQAFGDDDAAARALQSLRRSVKVPREAKDDIDSAVMEEIARRLGQGPELTRAVEAVLTALPAGPKASSWDYIARDAAKRLRRDDQRRQHRAPGEPALAETAEPADTEPTPDHVAALLEIFGGRPDLLTALRVEMATSDRKARRSGASKRRRADLRRALKNFAQP